MKGDAFKICRHVWRLPSGFCCESIQGYWFYCFHDVNINKKLGIMQNLNQES